MISRVSSQVKPASVDSPAATRLTRGGQLSRWRAAGTAVVRRHWLAAVLLAAGLVLRVLVLLAYRPALFYIDTTR